MTARAWEAPAHLQGGSPSPHPTSPSRDRGQGNRGDIGDIAATRLQAARPRRVQPGLQVTARNRAGSGCQNHPDPSGRAGRRETSTTQPEPPPTPQGPRGEPAPKSHGGPQNLPNLASVPRAGNPQQGAEGGLGLGGPWGGVPNPDPGARSSPRWQRRRRGPRAQGHVPRGGFQKKFGCGFTRAFGQSPGPVLPSCWDPPPTPQKLSPAHDRDGPQTPPGTGTAGPAEGPVTTPPSPPKLLFLTPRQHKSLRAAAATRGQRRRS